MADKDFTLTAELLRQLLDYDPETGVFIWKERPVSMFKSVHNQRMWNSKLAGKKAGGSDGRYWQILIFSKRHLAHRLAWLHVHGVYPEGFLDHVNCDGTDNRIKNLRQVTHSQNLANTRLRSNNKSGVKGVYWNKASGKWHARIEFHGKVLFSKYFNDLSEAKASVCQARKHIHGQYARTG